MRRNLPLLIAMLVVLSGALIVIVVQVTTPPGPDEWVNAPVTSEQAIGFPAPRTGPPTRPSASLPPQPPTPYTPARPESELVAEFDPVRDTQRGKTAPITPVALPPGTSVESPTETFLTTPRAGYVGNPLKIRFISMPDPSGSTALAAPNGILEWQRLQLQEIDGEWYFVAGDNALLRKVDDGWAMTEYLAEEITEYCDNPAYVYSDGDLLIPIYPEQRTAQADSRAQSLIDAEQGQRPGDRSPQRPLRAATP